MLAAFSMLAIPAYAHDTLISTDPADGDSLETSPEAITLTYSADILEVSPVVRIEDEAGETVADVEPTVEGPDVIATLENPLPAGEYTVQWRVVSSDGHPIEGSFAITVEQDTEGATAASDGGGKGSGSEASDAGGAEGAAAGPSDASDAGGTSDVAGSGSDGGSENSATEPAEESGSSMPLLLGGIGIVVVVAAIAAFFTLRKRS